MKLVCFDLDGTLVDETEYIWVTIYEHLGVDLREASLWAEKFRSGEITYEEWCRNDLRFLKEHDASIDDIREIVSKLRPMHGAHETLARLQEKGYVLAVISGSLDIILEMLFPNHPFRHVLINRLVFDKDGRIADIIPTSYDADNKSEGLKMIAKLEGITTKDCVFIGDNWNDISIAKEAGLAIAFNSKSEDLNRVCDVIVNEKDLRLILPHIR